MTPRAWSYGLLFAGILWAALIVAWWLIVAAQTVGVEAWHDSALPQGAFVAIIPRQGGAPMPTADRLPYNGSEHRRAVEIATVDGRAAADPDRPASVLTPPLTGIASWFASPANVSAAGPALRAALGSGWRGRQVSVRAGRRCVSTILGDWMAADRLIDLDDDVFARLAPLSQGLQEVTISW